MSDQFLGEIRIFGGNFAPLGWAECNGQLLSLSQNTALFSLLGTAYGGDGKSTFGLPNMQGCAPMQPGQGPGLTQRELGETGGEQYVTLLQSQMPSHTHAALPGTSAGEASPSNAYWGATLKGHSTPMYAASATRTNVQMNGQALVPAGGGLPHNNLPPYLGLIFIIALSGIFPPR